MLHTKKIITFFDDLRLSQTLMCHYNDNILISMGVHIARHTFYRF